MKNKIALSALLALSLFVATACGFAEFAAYKADQQTGRVPNLAEIGDLSEELYDILSDNYVEPDKLDLNVLLDGAVDGLLVGIAAQYPQLESFTATVSPSSYPLPSDFDLTPTRLDRAIERVYSEIYRDIEDAADYDFDAMQLAESAADGLVNAVADPYTAYFTADAYRRWQERLSGEYEGIGAYVGVNSDGYVYIERFLQDSPARDAGLLPDDAFHSVDGSSVAGLHINEVIAMIRGRANTEVTLGVLRTSANGEVLMLDFVVERRKIVLDTVMTDVIEQDGQRYGVLEINSFNEHTETLTRDALCALTADRQQCRSYCDSNDCEGNLDGIIIDLRGNGGGYLEVTVNTLSLFFDDGELPALYKGVPGRQLYEEPVNRMSVNYPDIPLVVLISGNSASGAEVFTGALRDHGRAFVSGKQSFGKGSVNQSFRTGNGGAVYATIQRWYTPCGDLIEGIGIAPDYDYETPEEAVALFTSGQSPMQQCRSFGVSQ